MDPINKAVRQFFADIEAYWLAHPGHVLPIIATDDQRAFVAQALSLREMEPDNERAYFVFHERFTSASSYFYGLAKAITEQYELLRTALAQDGVELPPFAGAPSTMPSGPVEYAARVMERAAQLFGDRLDGIVVALVPEHIASPKAWREAGRALAARRWSRRARVAVLSPPGGPLDDVGGEGVRFQLDADELIDHCADALGMPRSRRRRRHGLVVALAQIEPSIEHPRGVADQLLERFRSARRDAPASGESGS